MIKLFLRTLRNTCKDFYIIVDATLYPVKTFVNVYVDNGLQLLDLRYALL